jgi:hypothetical protein
MRKICFAILLLPALAWAQPKTADEWYKEGADQFNLGEYNKAVEAFKQGFTLEPDESKKPAYLYNVAQSYRLAKDCKNALFFYKRFLALRDANPAKPLEPKQRKDVNDKINELETCVQQANNVSTRPPTNTTPPGSSDKTESNAPGADKEPGKQDKRVAHTGGSDGTDEDDRSDSGEAKAVATRAPRTVSLRGNVGGSSINVGKTFEVPVQATFAVVAGRPIPINDKLVVEAGLAVTLTPVPYDVRSGTSSTSKTALFTGVMADGAATYEVAPKLGVRGDVGLGALFFSNVSESQFTNFAMTSGALTMFHLRVAVSADYAFTPNIFGTATPFAFTWSPPKSGLDSSIDKIITFDFMLGIGYRM